MLKIVSTKNGLVKGLAGNNTRMSVFKGIPYAKAPVGEYRWKAPMPANNWEGILNAYEFAPISIQDRPGMSDDIYCREWHVDKDIAMSEDCLYLNIWTPALSDTDKLPVLVWFFGGAFQWGYPSEMEFNGENTAKKGVIVCSVNYRLGAFGFLAHEELTKENPDSAANFGLLDQLAGLKWIKENIAAFGGDANNITIAGQSAGGASVLAHLTSPMSKGYFNKAILYSGIIGSPYSKDKFITPQNILQKEALGKEFLDYLGVSSINEARKLDALTIRDKYAEFADDHERFSPCIDGSFITDEPYKLFLLGKHANVPILTGNTKDEFVSFIEASSENDLAKKAAEIFGEDSLEFLKFEEAHINRDGKYAFCSSIADSAKCAIIHNNSNSYYYCFEGDIPGDDNPGTFHSVDLWFFFETLQSSNRPFTGRHYDLARKMCTYITNFVKTGNPNGTDIDGSLLPYWPVYSRSSKNEMHFTSNGCKVYVQDSLFDDFLISQLENKSTGLRKQIYNPIFPSYEYIPDGEPHVFDGRVYLYGSHDMANGEAFCLLDYVCYSADINDLKNWRYEGVIYKRTQDPLNARNNMCLFAPDVAKGKDGKYYLYYVLDKVSVVSVAVCDTPAGKYDFLGYVHYSDGTLLGEGEHDEPQFDPGVIVSKDGVFMYTGFCNHKDLSRHGAMVTMLEDDMITVKKAPTFIVPGSCYSRGTDYENHAFFEAPSIRFFDGKYYFVYSSEVMHELCYAISDYPDKDFCYKGVIVSNADIGIKTYKPKDVPSCYGSNNHGGLVEINGTRYIFYHRHTNNTWFSRQACAEKVIFNEDGTIKQAEITSQGLNKNPLKDDREYPAYIACNLFTPRNDLYSGAHKVPYIYQPGSGLEKKQSYIVGIENEATVGFKYFELNNVAGLRIKAKGYATGQFEIRTEIGGKVYGILPLTHSTVWEEYETKCFLPNGICSLYLTYTGDGTASLLSIEFVH